jgi:hypothetical protein
MSNFKHPLGGRLTYNPHPEKEATETFGNDGIRFVDKARAQVTVDRQYKFTVKGEPDTHQYRVTDGTHEWIALEDELT